MTRRVAEKCQPFDGSRWWGPEKYSIQNMLVREVNFPLAVHVPGDEVFDCYSDRDHESWSKAWEVFRHERYENLNYLGRLQGSTTEDFLTFCAMFLHAEKLDGARIVRWSDGGGYEIFSVTGVVIKDEQTKREPVNCSVEPPKRPAYMRMFGGDFFEDEDMYYDR